MRPRKDSAPSRMSVQDRANLQAAHNGDVEQRFGRWPTIAADDVDAIIHLQELRGCEAALVQSRRSNGQAQRLTRNHRAEVSTRSENPSARVETPPSLGQDGGGLRRGAAAKLFLSGGLFRRYSL